MLEFIIFCSVLAAAVFGVQFILCTKVKKKGVQWIPVYLILAVYATALIFCLIDVLNGSGGVAIWFIFAFIISVVNTVALAADILAWVIYKHIQRKRGGLQ